MPISLDQLRTASPGLDDDIVEALEQEKDCSIRVEILVIQENRWYYRIVKSLEENSYAVVAPTKNCSTVDKKLV